MSDLDFFEAGSIEGDHLALFPRIEFRPPSYLRRKPRGRRLVLVEQPPCVDCGGVVGPVTRICAACHFRGWWWGV